MVPGEVQAAPEVMPAKAAALGAGTIPPKQQGPLSLAQPHAHRGMDTWGQAVGLDR